MDSPCKNCEDRELGCHAYCIAYKKYDAERVAVRNKKMTEALTTGYVVESIYRQQKSKRC